VLPKPILIVFFPVGAGLALPIFAISLGAASRAPTFFPEIFFGQQALKLPPLPHCRMVKGY
jgi:hypothetical protein